MAYPAFAQDYEWLRINPLPFESTIKCATIIPGTNTVVAVGNYATLMYSYNNGESWDLQRRPGGIAKQASLVSVHFPSPSVGYILGNNSLLLKSTDEGISWTDISLDGNYDHQAIYFIDDETGFITGANGYILRTADGAVNWDTVTTFPGIKAGSLNFIDDATGFMGSTKHTYYLKTHDEGISWDSIPFHPIPDETKVLAVLFLDVSVGYISTSTDSNYNYTYRIFKTINGGTDWSEIYNSGLYCPYSFLFLDENTGFAMGSSVMYKDFILRTTDGGESWDLDDDFTWFLNSMVLTADQAGIVFATDARIYRSLDLGSSWEKESSSIFKSKIYSAEILNDSVVIAGGTESGGGVPSGRIIRSEDGGWSWHSVCFTLGSVRDICFPDGQTGYAVTDAGMFHKTTDGGLTWTDGEEIIYNPFYSVCFLNSSTGFIAGEVGNDDGLYRTTDGGETWQQFTAGDLHWGGYVYDIDFANESVGYLTGDIGGDGYSGKGGIMKTTDGGNTWFFLNIDPDCWNMNDIECIGDNIVLATGCNFILKSESAGATWSSLPTPMDNPIEFSSVHFLDENNGYAVGDGPGSNIIVTHDGGNSWEVVDSPTPAALTCALPLGQDKALLFGNSGVIFRLDTGYVVKINDENDKPSAEITCKIYPNPFSGQLNIDIDEKNPSGYSLEIYSITGERLKVLSIKNPEGSIHLDVPELAPGIYLVRIKNSIRQFQAKIIKTNSRT